MIRHRLITFALLVVVGCTGRGSAPVAPDFSDQQSDAVKEKERRSPAEPAVEEPSAPAEQDCHASYLSIEDADASKGPVVRSFSRTADPRVLFFGVQEALGPQKKGEEPAEVANAKVDDQRTTAHTLVLRTYGPTHWTITAARPSAIESILVIGADATTTTVTAPAGIAVSTSSVIVPIDGSPDIARDPQFEELRKIVGEVDELASAKRATSFVVHATPVKHCTPKVAEVAEGTPIIWTSYASRTTTEGGGLLRGTDEADASIYTANVTRDRGKRYFEARIVKEPETDSAIYIGVTTAVDSKGPAKYGCMYGAFAMMVCGFDKREAVPAPKTAPSSILGFAVDLDSGTVHIHVNGVWLLGAPGEDEGFAIARAPQFPFVSLRVGDEVKIVFDPASLKFPVPRGFTAGW